jgi:hypothetical protein
MLKDTGRKNFSTFQYVLITALNTTTISTKQIFKKPQLVLRLHHKASKYFITFSHSKALWWPLPNKGAKPNNVGKVASMYVLSSDVCFILV